MSRDFYLHEDEWGMIALEPEENRFERAKMVDEARAHGEAHRAPGGVGWTQIYVAPPAPIELATRRIRFDVLCEVLGPACVPYAKLTTGYSSHVEDVGTGFAFQCGEGRPWNVIYGCSRAGSTGDREVAQLHVTHCTAPIAEVLHRLGTTFRLILCDLWSDRVIELANRAAIDAYLADTDDD